MKRIVVFALVLNAALLGVIAHQLVAIAGGGAVATENGDTNHAVRLDSNSCRVLSPLPEPGVHPRIFFTADEYPLMRERLSSPRFLQAFGPHQERIVNSILKGKHGALGAGDFSEPNDEDLLRYFGAGEGLSNVWGVASLTAVLNEDEELKETMIRLIVNYGHIMLGARERAREPGLEKENPELYKKLALWRNDRFDVGVSWALGAAGYPLSYDVLYNDMTEEQRKVVADAIVAGTTGRRPHGFGRPRGYATSNHYGYHGDLAVMMAAVEGHPGFDRATWDGIVQILTDYWDISYTPYGASREDGYGPNLGMRGGGRGYMALARRGLNIFETEKYRKFLNYFAQDFDPYDQGHFNGGSSGGPYGELYPTSSLQARYMYPESPVGNMIFRQLIGDNYDRRLRWQGHLDYMIWGADWEGPPERDEMLASMDLPLSVFYPVRGKFIARSDWTADATYVSFDARPDGHLIGHDKADRGNFSMSALGRVWAASGDFSTHNQSNENSLVHIDGKGYGAKAPSVRMLSHGDDGRLAGAAADLSYAYAWEWNDGWPPPSKTFPEPWEPESSTAVELGWPRNYMIPELDGPIHGSDTGYGNHPRNLQRRLFNPLERAQRSVHLVRGQYPYTVIYDDIRKDSQSRLYEWIMQLPPDLEELSREKNRIILKEKEGDRQLLVQFLQQEPCSFKIENYVAREHRGHTTYGNRLIASIETNEPDFRVLLFPYRPGKTPEPGCRHDPRSTAVQVTIGDQVNVLRFTSKQEKGPQVSLQRR